jgi:hypothetical protein
MSATESNSLQTQQPTARAIRKWLGLLVAVWLGVQITATFISYFTAASQFDAGNRSVGQVGVHRAAYVQASAVAIATASLAFVFIVGGVGLILDSGWAWRVLAAGAALQILSTIATQIWQASIPPQRDYGLPSLGFVGAFIGILVWNIIPVGVLVLAVAGRPKQAKQ